MRIIGNSGTKFFAERDVERGKMKDISFIEIENCYKECQEAYSNDGLNYDLLLTIVNVYDGKILSFFENDEDNEDEEEKIVFKSYQGNGKYLVSHPDYSVLLKEYSSKGLEESLKGVKKDLELYVSNLEIYDEGIPHIMWEKRRDLCEQILNIENPLIESSYYVGGGVILKNLDDFKAALDSSIFHHDGFLRNKIIEEFQLQDCNIEFQRRMDLAVLAVKSKYPKDWGY